MSHLLVFTGGFGYEDRRTLDPYSGPSAMSRWVNRERGGNAITVSFTGACNSSVSAWHL